MRSTSLICLLALVLPSIGSAGGVACHLPELSTQEVSTLLGMQEKGTKRAYHEYFGMLLALSKKNDVPGIERCCADTLQPHVTQSICSLVIYMGEQKQDPKRFLANTPGEKDAVTWLWYWDALLHSQEDQKVNAEFPNGIAFYYFDQILLLIDTHPSLALEGLLKLDRYSDGEYGEYISDKLLTLFKDRPGLLVSFWEKIRPYRSSIKRMVEMYPEEVPQLQKQFGPICSAAPTNESCTEIFQILKP